MREGAMALIWPDPDDRQYWEGELLTTKGAAKALGVRPQTILNYVRDKRFPSPVKKTTGGRHYYLYSKKLVTAFDEKIREIRGKP